MRIPIRRRHPSAGFRPAAPWPLLMLVALGAWPLASGAQPRPADALPEALNPNRIVPPVQHQSAFARYRRLGEAPVGSWRDANDTVTRIGGWRVYTREAHAAEPPASAPAAPSAEPMPVPMPTAPASSRRADGPHGHHGAASPAGARP